MDYDMLDDLHAVLPIPPGTHPDTVSSLAPPMDDMLIDQDSALPASSAASVGADCAFSNDGLGIQRHDHPRPSNSGYAVSGVSYEDYPMDPESHDSSIVQQRNKQPRRQKTKKYKHPQGNRPPRPEETKRN